MIRLQRLGWVGLAAIVAVALATSARSAPGRDEKAAKPRLVTLTGTVVDLYSYMTGSEPKDERASAEHARMVREALKNGVSACLDTEDGLVVLGKGLKAPLDMLLPLAYQHVEVRGRLFEKAGVQYVDLIAIKALEPEHEEEAEGDEAEAEDEPETEEEP